ncbi:urease accessory protein UreD [Cellulomonas xiejunii]|uniref:Urease accessory protein UreD n=1 Tax=Cellulomonas xiejunii TaxID=2968083 RepID=A0ABY5KW75_9CELL|nr:urease accessory protein UreD [Cellulomonas xiejunii]MCC2322995.1 urease accessory protein UreD [Cellulomonas xiejunii]UUI73492.1 urease accessory protein UreD [Cellulomonas xiejunii]
MSADLVVEDVAVAPAAPYGGHRLTPAYYEPEHVPQEVARYSGGLDTLPVGSPAKVGVLELGYGRTGNGTELVHHYQKAPLHITRPLYVDPLRPDMPYTYVISTGAGVLQGDRLRTDLTFGPGASAHVTTTAATRAMRMEHDYGVSQVNLGVGQDAYAEYLPEPVIAFVDTRFYQLTRATVAPGATLILADTFVAGRLARDERHRYAAVAADLEIRRPDGTPVAVDRVRLVPGRGDALAVLAGHDVLGNLVVVTDQAPAGELADLLHDELADAPDVLVGVSRLPTEAGVSLRVVGDTTAPVAHAVNAAWHALRLRLTGLPAPALRKT